MAKESKPVQGAPQSQPTNAAAMQFEFIDRPDLTETYADSIHSISFDGQSLRLIFSVTRLNDVKQNQPTSGKRYPSCRLVLSVNAGIELINQTRQISAALMKAGLIKENTPAPGIENS
jgi:hypothetical protein